MRMLFSKTSQSFQLLYGKKCDYLSMNINDAFLIYYKASAVQQSTVIQANSTIISIYYRVSVNNAR